MNELLYLIGAIVVSVIGSMIILSRHRVPDTPDHGIDAFRRELNALSPQKRPVMRRPSQSNEERRTG